MSSYMESLIKISRFINYKDLRVRLIQSEYVSLERHYMEASSKSMV